MNMTLKHLVEKSLNLGSSTVCVDGIREFCDFLDDNNLWGDGILFAKVENLKDRERRGEEEIPEPYLYIRVGDGLHRPFVKLSFTKPRHVFSAGKAANGTEYDPMRGVALTSIEATFWEDVGEFEKTLADKLTTVEN